MDTKVKLSKSETFKYYDLIINSEKTRQNRIRIFIKNFKYILINTIKSYFRIKKAITEINDKKALINLTNEFNFFKIKNVAFQNSNKLGEIYLGNLISRHFSDLIIAHLINKNPTYFKEIQLSFKNIYELLKNYGGEIVYEKNKNKIDLICNGLTILIKEGNFNSKEFLEIFNPCNDILFAKDLIINDYTIKKEELNFVLEFLFFFKKN